MKIPCWTTEYEEVIEGESDEVRYLDPDQLLHAPVDLYYENMLTYAKQQLDYMRIWNVTVEETY